MSLISGDVLNALNAFFPKTLNYKLNPPIQLKFCLSLPLISIKIAQLIAEKNTVNRRHVFVSVQCLINNLGFGHFNWVLGTPLRRIPAN